MEYRNDNPCDRLGPVLGPQQNVVEHMRALPHGDVAGAIRKMWGSGATPPVKLAFEFLVLTAARSGEVRGARWAEIDLPARVWTVPAKRMKSKREHRIPLSGCAMEILDAARKLSDGRSLLVFPSQGGKPISITRLPRMLHNLKVAAVPHGFRSSFRDWAAERTDHPREVLEGGARPHRREPDRGGLRPLGPVRAPPPADGRVGGATSAARARPTRRAARTCGGPADDRVSSGSGRPRPLDAVPPMHRSGHR